jgi:ribosomal protein S18 acetylase RimI-like enzyme
MSIRPATSADIPRLAELTMEVHDLHVAHMPELFTPASRGALRSYYRDLLGSERSQVLVACEGDSVVGYMILVVYDRSSYPGLRPMRYLYVDSIGVTAAHRRRGHATALLAEARALARAEGIDAIELDSWAFNEEAHAFFRSQGFETLCLRMGTAV